MKFKPQLLIAFIVGGVIAAAVLWVITPTAPEPIVWGSLSDSEISEKMQTLDDEAVVDYQRWVVEIPLSTKYIVPANIANSPNQNAAMNLLNQEYPDFSRREGTALIQEIQRQPIEYRKYVEAQKAVYKFFGNR